MTKSVRIIASALALLTAASLSACSGAKTGPGVSSEATVSSVSDPMAKYDPVITVTSALSISATMQNYLDKDPDLLSNNIWNNSYKSELGINVNYIWTASASQFEQKMNTQIAANDLPDIIPCNSSQLKTLINNGVVADLTQVFKQYATPFTNEMMKDDNYTAIGQCTSDGKLYALPYIAANTDGAAMWWIREDWLKNLNLSEPKTMDDIIKIATAFAKNDPDKDGKADTYGLGLLKDLFGSEAGLDAFFEGYHAYYNGWLKDSSGKLVYGGIQPEVKTALTKLAELYHDGAIDQEFSVKDSNKVSEDIIAGKIGLFSGAHWLPFYPLGDSKKKDAKADWRAFPIVSCDDKPATPIIEGSASSYYAVSNKAKNPEAAVKLYNYFFDKDTGVSPNYDDKYHGHIDDDPTSDPHQWYAWAPIQSQFPQQNLYIYQNTKKYYDTKDNSLLKDPWTKSNYGIISKWLEKGDISGYAQALWSAPSNLMPGTGLSVTDYYETQKLFLLDGYIGANTDSMTQYNATLNQMRLTTFTKIIMGQSTTNDFDDYVTQWHKLGGDSITQEVNESK